VWAFQVTPGNTVATDLRVAWLPTASGSGVGVATRPNESVNDPGCDLALGAFHSVGASQPLEGGNCTVHEVVVYAGPLADDELMAVHAALKRKWK
jgi:hypothetical protein